MENRSYCTGPLHWGASLRQTKTGLWRFLFICRSWLACGYSLNLASQSSKMFFEYAFYAISKRGSGGTGIKYVDDSVPVRTSPLRRIQNWPTISRACNHLSSVHEPAHENTK